MAGTEGNESEDSQQSEERDADFSQLEGTAIEEMEGDPLEEIVAVDPAQNSALQAELTETKEKYLRALAELDNVQKRHQKERSELLRYQGERVFVDLLEIVDNFERALESGDGEQFREGIELIYKMLMSTLERWEVVSEVGKGLPFDPNKHAAISRIQMEDVDPGLIVEELKKAYFYKDRLLRPAEVVVSAQPEPTSAPEEDLGQDSDEEGVLEEAEADELSQDVEKQDHPEKDA